MIYHAAIKAKYPNAKFELRDDGEGVFFHSWEDEKPMPDIEGFHREAAEFAELHRQALEAKQFLDSTDWIIIRYFESNSTKDVSNHDEFAKQRNDARLIISQARSQGILI